MSGKLGNSGGRDRFDELVGRVAALGEPNRRALYRYVVAQPEPVGRDQAASAVGVARHIAKFHLDRLAAAGLLDTEYSRPPGRGGPGAGRPAKRYRRSSCEVSVSLPERRYDLAGQIMARAIAAANESGAAVADTLREAARAEGRTLGCLARDYLDTDSGPTACSRAMSEVLAVCGYEPRGEDPITLANCPFHELAHEHPDLVCGMNLDLIGGLLETGERSGLCAQLEPAPDRCCVTLGRRRSAQCYRTAVDR